MRLVYEGPASAPVVSSGDALTQILDNLLSNALDVSPLDTEVRVELRPAGAHTTLHVVDRGPGMTDEQRKRAFDRFWRAPDAVGRGSGLGLAIVAQLVAASSGTVELRVGPGGVGTEAVVTLVSAESLETSLPTS